MLLMLPSLSWAGGIALGSTRVVYPADARQVSLAVNNSDEHNRYLIQTWVESESGKKTDDFIVTPPLFVSKPKSENTLRIIYSGEKLPQDRETLYWLNNKAIPSVNKDEIKDNNVLQIAILARIKLFVRPAGLTEKSADAPSMLNFNRSGDSLNISNGSPFYVTLVNMSIGGRNVDTTMVPPKSSARVALPKGMVTGILSYQTINDYGANTPTAKVQIN
ncbi:fimbria/pilus periplasmic chaperone [Serratia fonticola]|uniref:fimbria/pilus periplasmic chaperone n=2 Tax=Serratia fonticola TaxID=47917 RepID=UPI0015C5F95F|nr:fimbria/pilus periplasmic chaperone [Serratia fonticola]NXZ90378.1 fimbria/pilus periplasmic chaperone [Serratia fonticola]